MKKQDLNLYIGSSDLSLVAAMQRIDSNGRGILFLTDKDGRLAGSVTDGDIRRWLIKTAKLDVSISDIMNPSPKTLMEKEAESAVGYMKRVAVKVLPVINESRQIVDIIFESDQNVGRNKVVQSQLHDVAVVVMAGGKGTRLFPYTKILPKPLIPIGDIPIMERILDRFCGFGVKEFFATVNYKKNMIISYFSDNEKKYKINYVEENKPLGTAGSIKLITEKFEKPFIVTNCDILIEADYNDIYRFHVESGNKLTIVGALKNIVVPYGVLNTKENGSVISLEEKPSFSKFINTGMYILNPDLVDEIPEDTFFHMTDLAEKLLQKGERVGMYPVSEDSFLDMGEFAEMQRMEEKLKKQ